MLILNLDFATAVLLKLHCVHHSMKPGTAPVQFNSKEENRNSRYEDGCFVSDSPRFQVPACKLCCLAQDLVKSRGNPNKCLCVLAHPCSAKREGTRLSTLTLLKQDKRLNSN